MCVVTAASSCRWFPGRSATEEVTVVVAAGALAVNGSVRFPQSGDRFVPPTGDHVGMVSKRVVAGWVIPTYCVVGAGLTGLYFFMSGSVDAQRVVYQAVGVFGVFGV